MSQVFDRKSNSIAQASLAGVTFLVVGTGVFWVMIKGSPWETEVGVPQDQPVPFSHKHHIAGLGLDCRYCHTSVTQAAFAGIPPLHTCMTCHSQIWKNAPLLEPIRHGFAHDTPPEWNRVYRVPKYVYFNHTIHVRKGIGCTSCHGPIETMPITWKANPFYMKDCLECHRNPENFIRPQDRVFDSPWNTPWKPPKNQRELGSKLVQDYHIPKNRLTDCYTCHR